MATDVTATPAFSGESAMLSDSRRQRRTGREKFYISLAHTDEDVDRTLEICDDAFAAVARG